MSIYQHETFFAGKQVAEWDHSKGIAAPETTIYRISVEYDDQEEWTDKFADFIRDPAAQEVTAIVVGQWTTDMQDDSSRVIEALASAREKLPRLTAIFLGDIISEENEISWINQADVSPLVAAYPNLEILRIRGATGLSFGTPRHAKLKTLIIESGGLGANVVREVLGSDLPAIEHLELWLGVEEYGGNTVPADFNPLLSGRLFPNLRYLGLRDSQIADEIAAAVATSALLERIRILDLSLGTLGDAGAQALLDSPAVRKLEKLDIHHHFCSDEMTKRLVGTLSASGVQVDVSENQRRSRFFGNDEDRYVAVSE